MDGKRDKKIFLINCNKLWGDTQIQRKENPEDMMKWNYW